MPKARTSAAERRNALPERSAFYITTDLVVSSRFSLAPLASALPNAHQPIALSGRPIARLLILNVVSQGSAEADLRRFIARISARRGAARRSWRTAGRRIFDIGIQAGNETRPFEDVRLSAAALNGVAALGAQIKVTVYRPGAYDMPESTQ